MIGPMIFSSVQIAATPIVPAPMKRTLLPEGRADERLQFAAGLGGERWRLSPMGNNHGPGDQHADDHRDADRHADQVADADQRHRQAGGNGGTRPRRP